MAKTEKKNAAKNPPHAALLRCSRSEYDHQSARSFEEGVVFSIDTQAVLIFADRVIQSVQGGPECPHHQKMHLDILTDRRLH